MGAPKNNKYAIGNSGRPSKKWNKKKIKEVIQKFEDYINNNDIPIIAEFAYQNNIVRQDLYKKEEFSSLLKKCIDKKQANLEKSALIGKINTTMAIFSLKQLGWQDKIAIDANVNDTTELLKSLSIEEKEKRIKELLDGRR